MPKILTVVPHDYSAKALIRIRRSLADSGIKTVIACVGDKRTLTSSNGKKTAEPKLSLDEVSKKIASKFVGVIVIGGKGASSAEFYKNDPLRNLLMASPNHGRVVGGIGRGMMALGHAYLLTSTEVSDVDAGKVTDQLRARLASFGAIITEEHATRSDGFVVTAAGPSYGDDFAASIVEVVEENTQEEDSA